MMLTFFQCFAYSSSNESFVFFDAAIKCQNYRIFEMDNFKHGSNHLNSRRHHKTTAVSVDFWNYLPWRFIKLGVPLSKFSLISKVFQIFPIEAHGKSNPLCTATATCWAIEISASASASSYICLKSSLSLFLCIVAQLYAHLEYS